MDRAAPTGSMSLLCLVDRDNPQKRELWRLLWLASNKWGEPSSRPASEIFSGGATLENVSLAALGQYRLLCGVLRPERREDALRAVFAVSPDLRNWRSQGPPDFIFPKDGRNARLSAPRTALLVNDDGIRLFYEYDYPNGAAEIRSAFCPRSAYRSGR